ncbi:hypothetical protein HN307_20670, partial [Acinetobacter baumannii]|nr:hypothetical protein [Acinetobacter baumannii]MBF6854183.1 hypothetical protein [Acinetobacter baumannii]
MAIFNAPDWSSIAIVGLVAKVIERAATPFLSLWGKIQHKIPNNVTKMLVSENGNIYVLQKLIVGNQKAPLVQQ